MRYLRIGVFPLVASMLVGCGDSAGPADVASVAITISTGTIHIGEISHVSATPLDAAGTAVPGVTCTFTSATPAIALIDSTTGTASALAVGSTDITATCASKSATASLKVIPYFVTLRVAKGGTGDGAIVTQLTDTVV